MSENNLEKHLCDAHPEELKLYRTLKNLISIVQNYTAQKWSRHLAVSDYFSDRWEKAKKLGWGKGSSVYDNVLILGDVSVGENTWVGPNCILDGSGKLSIGSFCSISAGVQIYTHDTVKWAISGGIVPSEHKPTIIGSRCYIGPNTVIAKGVTIGDRTIIGANSLVLKDIPPNSKAFGTPCRVVGKLD